MALTAGAHVSPAASQHAPIAAARSPDAVGAEGAGSAAEAGPVGQRSMRRAAWLVMLAVCAAVVAPALDAQSQTPVVFVHGFNSSPGTWEQAAAHFNASLAIAPVRPTLPWGQEYPSQAASLQSQAATLPSSTILVGHSNGGVVAREWSKLHGVSGVVTVGTPHGGAPLIGNLPFWGRYLVDTLTSLASGIGGLDDLSWRLGGGYYSLRDRAAMVAGPTSMFADLGWFVIGRLGLDAGSWVVPVTAQMRPGSDYLRSQLNSPGNLSREAGAIPTRIGVVSSASNYAGPWRAAGISNPEDVTHDIRMVAAILLSISNDTLFYSDAGNTRAWDAADALLDASLRLFNMDAAWCYAVSNVGAMPECLPNDNVVPTWSQAYPGGVNIPTGLFQGPSHNQETEQALPWIEDALVNYAHVPARSVVP